MNRLTAISLVAITVAGLIFALPWNFVAAMPQQGGEPEAAGTSEKSNESAAVRTFMRKKLVAADHILQGLTANDYTLVRRGAVSMIAMSKEATWHTTADVVYVQDSADFVRLANRLVKRAADRDLEGAAQTYARMTIACVDCHRRVRRPQDAPRTVALSKPGSLLAATSP